MGWDGKTNSIALVKKSAEGSLIINEIQIRLQDLYFISSFKVMVVSLGSVSPREPVQFQFGC